MQPKAAPQRFVCSTLKILLLISFGVWSGLMAAERRVAASFAPGFLTAQGAVAYGVGAEAEWYGAGGVSFRADIYALAATSKSLPLQQSYQGMFGMVYSFGDGTAATPFVGFQPGFGFAAVRNGVADGYYIYPVMSPVFGVHLPISERWQVTGQVRYVFGEMNYAETGAVYLSEFRAGLSLGYLYP